jgi:inositol-phosphate phosphatase/L-galactose 1-phosphate phosphatase/histidinol-phosphatase
MMMLDLDEAVALAECLADAAGAEIRPRFRRIIPAERKADFSPVTEADRAAEQAIRAILAAERPLDGVIGEEYGVVEGSSGLAWVIDPIDGTKSFMTGRASFATLIALLEDGRPVLGVIDQPIAGDRWIGAAGRPTLFNGLQARTRDCGDPALAVFCTTDPNLFAGGDAAVYATVSARAGTRTYGGDGYAYGLLASGWIDVVLESGLKLHDYAALGPVIEGAGGVITDWRGFRLDSQSDGRVLAAGSADLHDALLRLTRDLAQDDSTPQAL